MTRFPWWLSVLLAIFCYYSLKYGLPRLLPPLDTTAGLLPLLAPLVAMGFLLLAAKQLYDGDQQKDLSADDEEENPDLGGDEHR